MGTKFIDKLAFIYIKNKKVLMTLSQGLNTWYIPGGKRRGTETDQEALTREIMEELGVQILKDTISKYGVFEAQAHNKPKGTIVRMTCYTANFSGELKASSEIEKFDFYNYSQKNLGSFVDYLIFDDLKNKDLID